MYGNLAKGTIVPLTTNKDITEIFVKSGTIVSIILDKQSISDKKIFFFIILAFTISTFSLLFALKAFNPI
jgi:hypothetical protein